MTANRRPVRAQPQRLRGWAFPSNTDGPLMPPQMGLDTDSRQSTDVWSVENPSLMVTQGPYNHPSPPGTPGRLLPSVVTLVRNAHLTGCTGLILRHSKVEGRLHRWRAWTPGALRTAACGGVASQMVGSLSWRLASGFFAVVTGLPLPWCWCVRGRQGVSRELPEPPPGAPPPPRSWE